MTLITIMMIVLIPILLAILYLTAKQEKKISLLTQQQISLAEKLAKVNESLEAHPLPDYDVTDSIEQQINKAREKVFSEWIQNIANYTPFKNGE